MHSFCLSFLLFFSHFPDISRVAFPLLCPHSAQSVVFLSKGPFFPCFLVLSRAFPSSVKGPIKSGRPKVGHLPKKQNNQQKLTKRPNPKPSQIHSTKMSLIFLDPFDNRRTVGYSLLPFGGHRRHRNFCDPLELAERQMERSLAMIDRLFDDDMNVQVGF